MRAHPPSSAGGETVPAAPRRGRMEGGAVAGVFLLIGWFYFFTVATTGTLKRTEVNFDYYNLLVDGFRQGHLYLPIPPPPELLALPDPYAPEANGKLRLADASYYRGRYYIYFGVTPVVTLMLPYTLVTGQHLPQSAAVLFFCLVGVAAASGVWLAVRRRYFPASAWWVAPFGVAVIGLGSHVLALARRPSVWELPIAASFAFTMLALAGAYVCLHGRRPVLAAAASAAALGLATGARPTALLTGGLLVLALWQLRRRQSAALALKAATAAALVLASIGVGLAWYNYARFGSFTEFGQHYQLTGLNERTAHHFSPRFILYNLSVYFTWPVQWTPEFPYVASRPLPPWPKDYFSGEELYCLALLSPVLWFLPAGALGWRHGRPGADFGTVVAMLGAVFVPLFVVMLCFFYAAERYMVDFVPTLMLLALSGVLVVERAAGAGVRWWRAAFAITAGVTILAGVLASFDYHGRSMQQTAPQAWAALSLAFDWR